LHNLETHAFVYFLSEIRKRPKIKLHIILIAKINKTSSPEEGGENKFFTSLSGDESTGKFDLVLATCYLVSISNVCGKDARF